MTCRIVFVLLLGVTLSRATTEKIQLEDIERDNLISEQRSKAANEGLDVQQTAHLRPPGIQVIGGVTYATGQPDQQATIEFVTLPPQYPAPQMPQVHEEDRTHSAPSRQSLLTPQQPQSVQASPQPRPQHTFAPQPQYVYVQAIPQPQKPISQQPQYQTSGQETETPGQSQAQQSQQLQFISLPQRDVQARAHPSAGQGSFVSVPYNYGGMYASPSAPTFTYQSPHSHFAVPSLQSPFHQHHQSFISGPTPTPGIQYAASHASPSPVAYVKSTHPYLAATQVPPFASYQHSFPQTVEYSPPISAASTKLLPVSSHHSDFHPTLDFHGQSSNYHSLLDSYIPSSFIYARTKAALGHNYPLRGAYSHFAPSFHFRPSHSFDAHGAGSLYNTVTYSADGVHLVPGFTAKRAVIPGA